jgi:hypothetical protein
MLNRMHIILLLQVGWFCGKKVDLHGVQGSIAQMTLVVVNGEMLTKYSLLI